jgi:hypothetical protein
VMFILLVFKRPKPPMALGLHIDGQLTRWHLCFVPKPSQKNLARQELNLACIPSCSGNRPIRKIWRLSEHPLDKISRPRGQQLAKPGSGFTLQFPNQEEPLFYSEFPIEYG